MSTNLRIRVCLKCRSYMIIHETPEIKKRLEIFERDHRGHTLITTAYAEKDNLECGEVVCENEEDREALHYVK